MIDGPATGMKAGAEAGTRADGTAEGDSPRKRALWFGGGALVFLGAVGAWLFFRKHNAAAALSVSGVGGALFALALVSPAAALAVRAAWMKLAAAIGWVNSRILLSVIFFVMLTPLAFAQRLFGRRGLDMQGFRGGRDAPGSTWMPRGEGRDPKHYEHPW